MCGIAGCYNFIGRDHIKALTLMRDSLTHRGPDDSGVYFDDFNCVGLAHRRLSVLDLSILGHQPMSNDEGSVWMVFNGEVYNFKEIREKLISKGFTFKSNSDSEVVLKAYLQWGIECVNQFIGMFAIAFWDKRTKTLYLLRDRIGIKPLYYYYKEGRLLFGSELKSLMAHPGFPKEIDYNLIPSFLRYGYIPTPHTIFQHTFKVKPGHYLCLHGNKISEVKYWDANDFYLQESLNGDEDDIADELETLIIDSSKYRLLSDVPIGIFLSGGIDSTTLTALLQKNTSNKLKTFSIGFHENAYNEAQWARKIAQYLDTDHTEYYVSAKDCLDIIEKLPYIYDEPFGDNSGIPTLLLSKITRKNVTVALAADGGDELFGGYNHYKTIQYIITSFNRIPQYLRKKLVRFLNIPKPAKADKIYNILRPILPSIKDFKDKYEKYSNIFIAGNNHDFAELYRHNCIKWTDYELDRLLSFDNYNQQKTYFEDSFQTLKNIDFTSQMMAVDLKTFLLDDILTKVDRASMSVSLECREPFLDHRLVEYSARIPYSIKCKNGIKKYILRKVLYKHVPKDLVDRPKKGFVVPLSEWLKSDLYPILMDYLNEDKLRREGIFNEKMVSINIQDFLRGSVSEHKIWYILMFQMWKDMWISN